MSAAHLLRWGALALAVVLVLGARTVLSHQPDRTSAAPDDAHAQAAEALLAAAGPVPPAPAVAVPRGTAASDLRAGALPLAQQVAATQGLVLTRADFLPREAAGQAFTRVEGVDLGLEQLPLPPLHETVQLSANEHAPLAVGDVDGDGWPDVAVGSAFGVQVYRNTGGRLSLQRIDFPAMRDWRVTALALVDLDGSGAPDLFFCAWMQSCHVLLNRGGVFSSAAHVELPRGREVAVHAVAFADVDRDGHLDVVTGSAVGLGWQFTPFAPLRIHRGRGQGRFDVEELPGPTGEALSLLFTDLDGDGWPDLWVGNDFDEPDVVYRNDGGRLVLMSGDDLPFPHTTESTMSVDSGDLDNDGRLELYLGQIAYGGIGMQAEDRPRMDPHLACRTGVADGTELERCLTLADFQTTVVRARDVTDVRECGRFPDAARVQQCVAVAYLYQQALFELPADGATTAAVLDTCAKIPPHLRTLRDVCAVVPHATMDHSQAAKVHPDQRPQVQQANVLLAPGADGYTDAAHAWGATFGGWTWNARFADIDNDTWQDLYVTQGTRLRFSNTSNLLYRNQGGSRFAEQATELGLAHHVPTGGSVFLDVDLDGRLDIITHPFGLTPVLWRNDLAEPRALQLSLRDERSANRDAVGARVEVRAADGRLQVREIKGSGGFGAGDPPVAWFGLGSWPGVASITVTWPDGSMDVLDVPVLEPGRYTLTRTAERAGASLVHRWVASGSRWAQPPARRANGLRDAATHP